MYTLDVSSGSFSLSASSAELVNAYSLNVNSASYLHTGTSIGLIKSNVLDVNSESISFIGNSASVAMEYPLTTTSGVYSLTANAIEFDLGYILNVFSSNYSFNPNSVFIEYGQVNFSLDVGNLRLVLFDQDPQPLAHNKILNVESGNFNVSGSPLDVYRGRNLLAETGSFALAGGNSETVTTTNRILDVDSGSFSLTHNSIGLVYNRLFNLSKGDFSFSANTVTIDPNIFTLQPSDTTAAEGSTATLTSKGFGAGTYQWYSYISSTDTLLLGKTGSSLVLNSLEASQTGNEYYVVFTQTSSLTSITSRKAVLTVEPLPVITAQPTNTTVNEGANASFVVSATGTGVLTYQWYTRGAPIAGETGSSITILGSSNVNGADYYVVVSDDTGLSVTSNTVYLSVNLSPSIIRNPSNKNIFENTNTTFSVVAVSRTNNNPLTYQWYNAVGPTLLVGETSNQLQIIPALLTDNGNTYYVVVTDSVSGLTAQSSTVTLSVVQQTLAIVKQPNSLKVAPDATQASFSVIAVGSGVGQPTYEWYDANFDTPLFPAETGATLTVLSPFEDNAAYYVKVSDDVNISGIDSKTVTLDTIVEDLFSFTLPAEFGATTIVADRGLNVSSNARIFKMQFGDGYSQRSPGGLSNITDEYSITLKNRPSDTIDKVGAYFSKLANIQAFPFIVPSPGVSGGKETILVTCENYSINTLNTRTKTLTAKLRRVFETEPTSL